MKIKHLKKKNIKEALPLVWEVFCNYEAINYEEAGKQAFYEAIHSEEYLDTLDAYGAYEDHELLGILATRSEGSHIALFFVDGAHHNQGIGRSLWNELLSNNTQPKITVHSSIYAVPVYEKLGFVRTGEIQTDGGIQFLPMEYTMKVNPDCPCKKIKCKRHGHCNECKARHTTSKKPPVCER